MNIQRKIPVGTSMSAFVKDNIRSLEQSLVTGGLYTIEPVEPEQLCIFVEDIPGSVMKRVRTSTDGFWFIAAGTFIDHTTLVRGMDNNSPVVLVSAKLLIYTGVAFSGYANVLHPVHGPGWVQLFYTDADLERLEPDAAAGVDLYCTNVIYLDKVEAPTP